jgi:hypothetical protein
MNEENEIEKMIEGEEENLTKAKVLTAIANEDIGTMNKSVYKYLWDRRRISPIDALPRMKKYLVDGIIDDRTALAIIDFIDIDDYFSGDYGWADSILFWLEAIEGENIIIDRRIEELIKQSKIEAREQDGEMPEVTGGVDTEETTLPFTEINLDKIA